MAADKEDLLINKLKNTFRDGVLDTSVYRGDVTHVVDKKALRAVCNFLKTDPDLRMNFLVDIAGVDYHPETPRFEVVYRFYSIQKKHRICVKIRIADGEPVPSLTSIWPGADWPEREAYDMFGIIFEGHPNLKRIYLAEDWEGFPLRKDYPLKGYKDRYNPYGEEKPEK